MTFLKKTLFIFALLLNVTFNACKKDAPEFSSDQPVISKDLSKNSVTFSTNGGVEVEYKQSSYNPSTEWNGLYKVSFARTYYTTSTRLPEQYNTFELSLQDMNIFKQTFPYTVKKAFLYIATMVPTNIGTFAFDSSLNQPKGNLTVIVTSAKDKRVKGTYEGVIFSSYNVFPKPESIAVKGTFDILLPEYVDFNVKRSTSYTALNSRQRL